MRGLLSTPHGPNAWPTYSVLDAIRVAAIADLKRIGVDLTVASTMANCIDESRVMQPEFYLQFGSQDETVIASIDVSKIYRRIVSELRNA